MNAKIKDHPIYFNGVYPEEVIAFDMYFASVCSMQYHPGAGTKEHKKLTVEACKDVALDMIKKRREVNVCKK